MSTSIDDAFARRVQFNDGEGIDPTDFVLMQQRALRSLSDAFLFYGIYDGIDDPTTADNVAALESSQALSTLAIDWATDIVMAPFPGSGYFAAGASARQLVSVPGPMVMVSSNPSTGLPVVGTPATADAAVVMAKLGGFALGDMAFTLAVGDATNPRVDLIEIQVTYIDGTPTSRDFQDATTRVITTATPNKERWVRVTAQVNQGTPAASPVYPTPTSGFRAICAVYVPAAFNAVIDPTNIRDLRFPLGNVDVYDVHANQFVLPTSGWTYAVGSTPAPLVSGPASGTQSAYAICPVSGNTGRLIGVGTMGVAGSGAGGAFLTRFNMQSAFSTTDLVQTNRLWSTTFGYTQINATGLMTYGPTGAGSITDGSRVVTNRVGHPYWTNGYRCGPALGRGLTFPTPLSLQTKLAMRYKATADVTSSVAFTRWFIARGF